MPTHIITLGNDMRVTVGQYVRAIKTAKANPDAVFKHGLRGWWPVTGREILREFLDGVHDRIDTRAKGGA